MSILLFLVGFLEKREEIMKIWANYGVLRCGVGIPCTSVGLRCGVAKREDLASFGYTAT